MPRRSIWLGLLLILPTPALPQADPTDGISVSVEVTERTNGIFESIFKQAFRRIGDITIVSAGERPDYSLGVLVLCDDNENDCRASRRYVLSIDLYSPIRYEDVSAFLFGANEGLPDNLKVPITTLDSLTSHYWIFASGYRTHHQNWVTYWGRDRYRQAAEELVAEIDARCFGRARLVDRLRAAYNAGDNERKDAISRELSKDGWICH
jgi:hypothetical protein